MGEEVGHSHEVIVDPSAARAIVRRRRSDASFGAYEGRNAGLRGTIGSCRCDIACHVRDAAADAPGNRLCGPTDLAAVSDSDHEDGADAVYDGEREQEQAQTRRGAPAKEDGATDDEDGVRRDHRPPAVLAKLTPL